MPKRFHDTELRTKDWWLDLIQDQKSLLHANVTTPTRLTPLQQKPDIDEFISACNSDGRERMIKVDGGSKLIFCPTIKFQYRGKTLYEE